MVFAELIAERGLLIFPDASSQKKKTREKLEQALVMVRSIAK